LFSCSIGLSYATMRCLEYGAELQDLNYHPSRIPFAEKHIGLQEDLSFYGLTNDKLAGEFNSLSELWQKLQLRMDLPVLIPNGQDERHYGSFERTYMEYWSIRCLIESRTRQDEEPEFQDSWLERVSKCLTDWRYVRQLSLGLSDEEKISKYR